LRPRFICVLLIDALGANLVVHFGSKWYVQHFRTLSREGWALYYLVLVLWVGSLLYRVGMLL
jgi:hypothetical protein